jgi:hypothetical protein
LEYHIQKGDTLSEITKRCNEKNGTSYSVQEVADANGIENIHEIKAGDILEMDNWENRFDVALYELENKEGQTAKEFENEIRASANKYQNTSPYFPIPWLKKGTSNCNSFVGTVLRDVYYGGAEKMQETFDQFLKENKIPFGYRFSVSGVNAWLDMNKAEMFKNAIPDKSQFRDGKEKYDLILYPGWDVNVF